MQDLKKIKAQSAAPQGSEVTEQALLALINDPEVIAEGQTLWAANCMACHMAQGQGLVGPNLTDNYWIHGGKITDIQKIIVNGVPEKGMIAWKDRFSTEQINALTVHVWNLVGTNPPNGKKPEGELVERN
jgi:cytochrome c oxidase cbb3-type subunit 3